MRNFKATLDFQLLDNGTATATLTPNDSMGQPTTLPAGTPAPAWASSDPAIVVTAAADGLSAALAPATPPVLAIGVVITANATLPSGVVITGTGNPIDVVAGGPTGFSIVESANQQGPNQTRGPYQTQGRRNPNQPNANDPNTQNPNADYPNQSNQNDPNRDYQNANRPNPNDPNTGFPHANQPDREYRNAQPVPNANQPNTGFTPLSDKARK